ncbi:MAG: hypothetical protein Q9162_007694 [Coniocarpon cinnabarinum]
MSERKVLTKYYPPDFDPSAIGRVRKPKDAPKKLDTVRLMAPFSMKCAACGEYIYKGRKFNARKQITDQTYYAIKIIRFYIKCTRCSAEMTFITDPKHNDYQVERGMRRNFEPWREAKLQEETEEERLDRLEAEERDYDRMAEVEAKIHDEQKEREVEDALDNMRTRNARMERKDKEGVNLGPSPKTEAEMAREQQEAEDAEAAKKAFQNGAGEGKVRRVVEQEEDQQTTQPMFAVARKRRKLDYGAAMGIKKAKIEVSAESAAPTMKSLVEGDEDDFW